jgi:hypothetical protein
MAQHTLLLLNALLQFVLLLLWREIFSENHTKATTLSTSLVSNRFGVILLTFLAP